MKKLPKFLSSPSFVTLALVATVIWAGYRLYDSNFSALENAMNSFRPLPPNGTYEEVLARVHFNGDVLRKASNDISIQRFALILLEISTPYMGLPAPLRVLEGIESKVFASASTSSRAQLAKYADAVSKAAARSVQDATQTLSAVVPDYAFRRANLCAVGNLAYMALNAPTPELKAKADAMFEEILVARRSQRM